MNSRSIEHRAFKNTALGLLSFAMTMGQTVVLVPILLKYWGNAKYGLWLTLTAGFSLLQTLDLGHQNYVGNQLNMQYHTDAHTFQRTLGSSLLVAYLLGLVEISLCLVFILSGSLSWFLNVPSSAIADHQISLSLMLLMMMWLGVGSAGGILVRVLIPAGMLAESQWIGMAIRLVQFLPVILVAAFGGDILAACLWYAVTQTVLSMLAFWYIRVKLPQFYPWWHGADWRVGLEGLRKSIVLTANSIGQQLSNNGLIILISALFTSAFIPAFTTLRTLTNTAGAVTTIFMTALLPDMIRFHAKEEVEKLEGAFYVNWFISGTCVNFGIVLVLPIIRWIYELWTKGLIAFNPTLFLLLAAAISLANFGAGLYLYLWGTNDLKSQGVVTFVRVGILFLVSYCLSAYCGILAVGIGCVIAEMLASVVLPVMLVNRRLARFSSTLAGRHLCLAGIPPFLLVLAGGVALVHPIDFHWIAALLLPTFCAIYYANWRILGEEVQSRIRSLWASVLGRYSFAA